MNCELLCQDATDLLVKLIETPRTSRNEAQAADMLEDVMRNKYGMDVQRDGNNLWCIAGDYTTEDMAAGDTVFGDHETLIARVPKLMESTQRAIDEGQHPMIVAAKFHGYYEYLHPFRDGNGRTGRLLSNFILLRADHPLLIIKLEDRSAYISSLKQIRTESTDEHLIAFFFKTAIDRMKGELAQKKKNTLPTMFF